MSPIYSKDASGFSESRHQCLLNTMPRIMCERCTSATELMAVQFNAVDLHSVDEWIYRHLPQTHELTNLLVDNNKNNNNNNNNENAKYLDTYNLTQLHMD